MHNISGRAHLTQRTNAIQDSFSAPSKKSARIFLAFVIFIFALLWINATEDISLANELLATLLGIMLLFPMYQWLRSYEMPIPFLGLISLHYFFIFCPPVFLGPIHFVGAVFSTVTEGEDLTRLLLAILLGSFSMFAGYYMIKPLRIKILPAFHITTTRSIKFFLFYLALSAFGFFLVPRLPGFLGKFGDIVFRVNGVVSTYALAMFMYTGKLSKTQRNIFLGELLLFLMTSAATGWLSLVIYPVAGFLLGEIQVRRRLPLGKLVSIFVLIIALQTAKNTFRQEFWGEDLSGTQEPASISDAYERTAKWLQLAFSNLADLEEGTKETALERANHLSFFGHVFQSTPEHIPYLLGQSYRGIPAMLIPRFLWPEKPSTMQITDELAIRYGWLSPEMSGKVAVSAGIMDEAYMNFGIPGIVSVMFLFGYFVRFLVDNFANTQYGLGWQLALLGFILSGGIMITWTATNYLGGLWQTVAAIALLYWPLRVKKTRERLLQRS